MTIADLKPYPTMKDSGVPWLGNIPEHWMLQRTKTLLRERVEKGFPDEPLLAATQKKGVVRKEQYENRTVLALKDLHLLKLVKVGDFVISLRSFQGGIEYAREQGIISPAYTVLYPPQPRMQGFLAWLFKSQPYIENLSLFVTGIRQGQNIDYEKLGRLELPLPPLPEQAAIVRYIDYMDRRIRRYIRAKQKLIKLLEEQKQAIIHHAVTRGLNPNVRLKPSGVEWLGDVPEHWEVRKIGSLGIFYKGRGIARADITDTGVPAITYGDIYTKYGIEIKSLDKYTSGSVAANAQKISKGDLLFTASGETIEEIGKTTLYSSDVIGYAGGDIIILQLHNGDGLYLSYALNCRVGIRQKSAFGRGDIIVHISASKLKQVVVPFPPLEEQDAIAKHLDSSVANVANAISHAHCEIALLREYRTRLIADVVTGKLDVREAATRLPDETDKSESIDEPDELNGAEEDMVDDLDAKLEEEIA